MGSEDVIRAAALLLREKFTEREGWSPISIMALYLV